MGNGHVHTSGLFLNRSTTCFSGLTTKTPTSIGSHGLEMSHARRPAEYHDWKKRFGKISGWWVENSRRRTGSPGPPTKQFSARFSGTMYWEMICGLFSLLSSRICPGVHGHVVVPFRSPEAIANSGRCVLGAGRPSTG